jgi:transposase
VIQVAPGTKVYLACRPVSMRYGFDGLAAQAKRVVDGDPFSGHLFLFRSKRADYLKILYYDGTGLCLFAKRLENGKFVWPPIVRYHVATATSSIFAAESASSINLIYSISGNAGNG